MNLERWVTHILLSNPDEASTITALLTEMPIGGDPVCPFARLLIKGEFEPVIDHKRSTEILSKEIVDVLFLIVNYVETPVILFIP